jgi:hypothetical protein
VRTLLKLTEEWLSSMATFIHCVQFKTQPQTSQVVRHKKWNQKQALSRVIYLHSLPRDTRVVVKLFLGRCSRQLRKNCASAKMVCSQAESVFVFEHYYFATKSFAAVREVLRVSWQGSTEYDNITRIGNTISGHRKCLCVISARSDTKQITLRPHRFQSLHQL